MNLELVTYIIGIAAFLVLNIFSIVSIFEKEKVAARRLFFVSWLTLILFSFPYFFDAEITSYVALTLLILVIIFTIALLIPYQGKLDGSHQIPVTKHDERDTMFSRRELKPESDKYDAYYENKPEYKSPDDKFRAKPGLLSPESKAYDPIIFASTDASFYTVSAFGEFIDGSQNEKTTEVDPASITKYIKNWSKKLGAVDCGVTVVKPYHLYSVKGRREKYGKEITNSHKYAIAITVEMDKFNMDTAPYAPTVFESAQQYLLSGTIAIQIAKFIRELGYAAKAHIDGNYEVVCPLVARDAGLGEIGRMGLLMTPDLGPRVRIAVITTDLPLVTSEHKPDNTVTHFCEICKKCATNCPSNAISFDKREEIEGVNRWKINAEACFTYWCVIGTDCGKCIKVCPYAHPDNLMHSLIRERIRNNVLFRHLALYLDDFFYGKKPSSGNTPKWMQLN